MAEKRKAISKKLRFEVFKRDSFTCQYCGRKSPDIILHIDHINPVSKGGENDILNLITSCVECNLGKSDRKLTDGDILKKKRKQLEFLQERKEQIQMMYDWQLSLLCVDEEKTEKAENLIYELCGSALTEIGRKKIKKLVRKFDYPILLESIVIAFEYYDWEEDFNNSFNKIGGIAFNKQIEGNEKI